MPGVIIKTVPWTGEKGMLGSNSKDRTECSLSMFDGHDDYRTLE